MDKKRRGQVMVEAAIGMALFLMLTLGAIETARFALRRIQITYASFQANRVAIVNKGDTTSVRKTLQTISTHIKDAKFELKDEGDEYSLTIKKTFHPLIPFIDVDSLVFAGYSRLPKGHFQNKEFPYKYKGYSTYYPALWNSSDMEDEKEAGILTYDRYLRAFIRCENNKYEAWRPGWGPFGEYGGGGEAEIKVGGKDEQNDPFHLETWYPPYGILRNKNPEKDRTGNQALIDQYYFVEAMLIGFSTFPFLTFYPENKPYWSRAITGFGHGNNINKGSDAHPYRGDFLEYFNSQGYAIPGWYGFWPRYEALWWTPVGCADLVTGMYYIGMGNQWFGEPWGEYYKDSDNYISGWGTAYADACWDPIDTPWGCIPGAGVGDDFQFTIFNGWFANYRGHGAPWDWKGTRRLYDAAFYVATFNEIEWIYLVEGFMVDHPDHGKSLPLKDDLRGWGTKWDCLWYESPWDEWNGKEKQ